MKTLKKKFSIYQSSQKVRKLWADHVEGRSDESRDTGVAGEAAIVGVVGPSSLSLLAPGQGARRALRAFVDAVDLSDAKQAVVLQNLDDGGHGEVVDTLLAFAGALMGSGVCSGSFKPSHTDSALAEKSLKLVETCLAGSSKPKRPRDWKALLRQLLAILACDTGGGDGRGQRYVDAEKTSVARGTVDVKASALRVLHVVAADHERVVEVGRCTGFQTIAQLALPQGSPLSYQATATIAHLLITSESDRARSPTASDGSHRARTGRWGRVSRFGNGSRSISDSRSRMSGDCSSKGAEGEEGGQEAGVGSSSSSSSLAGAASFVYSSFQTLVGRESGALLSGANTELLVSKIMSVGHPPMAVLRESLREEAARVAALGMTRSTSLEDGLSPSTMDKINDGGEVGSSTASPDTNGLAEECSASTGNSGPDVAEMMLAQGVLAVLVDVIAPHLDAVDAEAGKGDGTTRTMAVSWTRMSEFAKATGAQFDALEAAVLILEGRPQAQAEFTSRGGFGRVSRLMHLVAASEFIQQQQPCDAGDSKDRDRDRDRGRSAPRSDSDRRREERSLGSGPSALDATFDALFRLAINGRSVLPEASADGVQAVSALLTLAARSPSVKVTLRAARSLQALLRVRPLNAVIVERHDGLGLLTDAAADLVFPRVYTTCGGVPCSSDKRVCDSGDADAGGDGRVGWGLEEKGEVLSTLNEVVRMLAAVYSRQDARALERYAGIMSAVSSARFGDGPHRKLGSHCSSCCTAALRVVGTSLRRCLVEGCSGAGGLCVGCDARRHHEVSEGSHVRVPLSSRGSRSYTNSSHSRPDPAWAVEGGKALLKALVAMLDDRESFGLPPNAEAISNSVDAVDTGAGVKEQTPGSNAGVLTAILYIVQDELLAPWHVRAELDNHTAGLEQNPTAHRTSAEGLAGENACDIINTTKSREGGGRCWTDGWLLGALEVVARLVVRGDDATVEELGAAGGWGLLAHIICLSASPGESPSSTLSSTQKRESRPGAGQANGRMSASGRTLSSDPGEQLSETWLGWVGARRLALWIMREALLTGAGQQRSREKIAVALTQPARWLVWLVQNLMTRELPCTCRHKGIFARDESLMRFAVLNELRLAIGSFAPCEVVMQGCTRVLPLVALSVDHAESTDSDVSEGSIRKAGVSPNRHPQAQSGAANVKVVGRLAGDQRGVVLDTLVSEGLDEALLAVVGRDCGDNTSSLSSDITKAESSLAMLCLAELAAGSEKAKARLGSTLGYDRVGTAAHGASVAMHAQQFSLWLEASVRRLGSGKVRLPPPFLSVLTDTRRIPLLANIESTAPGGIGELSSRRQGDAGREALANDQDSNRGRTEVRGGRRRSWKQRSPRGKANPGVKDGMTWVTRTLPKLPRALSRGTGGPEDEDVDAVGTGSFEKRRERNEEPSANACLFNELWLPPGLLTLAQDVLLINRTRGIGAVRGEERYFIAQAGVAETATGSASGASLWRPFGAKFRGLEAAVFPFLLLPLIPMQYQPQAAGQLSRLLDANPANAAALCYLRAPLALLKLACRLPDQSHVRDLYFRLAAQLMSHHMSPADAMELFHLASLQPSAWARLGRLQVASSTNLIQGVDLNRQGLAQGGATVDGCRGEQERVQGHVDGDVALPPHSGDLQMQLLYVIGTVLEAPAPAWFFHMDGGTGSGLVAGPLPRFPSQRVGYSLSIWLRPALFSGGVGGETTLFSLSGGTEEGAQKLFLRVSLRRCQRPRDVPALRAAAGIGANEDDDHDNATDDGLAVVEISTSVESTADQRSEPVLTGEHRAIRIGVVRDPEVRCGRWQHLIITHTNESAPSSSAAAGPWFTGNITVYIDGERRTVSTAGGPGKSMLTSVDPQVPAYPVAGSGATLSASVGCDEDSRRDTSAAASTVAAPAAGKSPARFHGQIATVALVERAWTTEMAKAVFLRGPGAAPPGKRIIYTEPGDLPPTPFLDSPRDDEVSSSGNQTSLSGDEVQVRGSNSIDTEGAVAMKPGAKSGEARLLDCRGRGQEATEEIGNETGSGLDTCVLSESESALSSLPRPSNERATADSSMAIARQSDTSASSGTLLYDADVRDPPSCRATQRKAKRKAGAPPRLSVLFAPLRRALDGKYGIAPENLSSKKWSSAGAGALDKPSADGTATVASATGGGDVSMTVASLAAAAGCGGSKESKADGRLSFKLAGRGTWVYATTPLHAAVQAAGGFRLCLPFLRMDHARQVAALRVLAGLLEASAEGMDAFRVRDGFNVLYHALAQGDDALQQLSMDSFDTLFELMTSEALQGVVDVPPSSLSSLSFLDATGVAGDADGGYGDGRLAGVKPVRSPEALRLVVDLVGHCERAPELQAKVMEALVDALDGSSTGIQVWRRAFDESGAFAPLLYLLSPPMYACFEGEHDYGTDPVAGVSIRSPVIRRVPSFLSSSASGAVGLREDVSTGKWVSSGEKPAVAAGPAARTQATRMLQVLIAGSAGVAPVVRPKDPAAAVASSTSAGCTPEQLSILVGFVLRCHLEAEELVDMVRREILNTGQEDSWGTGRDCGPRAASGSTASLLALTRRVGGTVLDLLVQLCGGDGGAVVVGMMSMAFPGGGHFFVPLELMSSSHVDTRVSAIKLLSLMLVRKGDDGRRSSTSGLFSSDETSIGGRPGPDPQALRTFEKRGGFAAMCHQLEMHAACQAVCDALMGMIFGVWGSKHEPRPIRERDVLDIKGNKESWLRAWWRDYSDSPDDEPTNPTSSTATITAVQGQAHGQPATGEGSSLVDRLLGATVAPPAAASSSSLPTQHGGDGGDTTVQTTATSETVASTMDEIAEGREQEDKQQNSCAKGDTMDMTLAEVDPCMEGETADAVKTTECTPIIGEEHSDTQEGVSGVVKPGRFAALLKVVEAHNSIAPLRSEAAVHAAMLAHGGSGGVYKVGDKEETGFLSGFFKRLSLDHAGGDNTGTRTDCAVAVAKVVPPTVPTVPAVSETIVSAVSETVPGENDVAEADPTPGRLNSVPTPLRTEAFIEEDKQEKVGTGEQNGYHAEVDASGGESGGDDSGGGGGGGSNGAETSNVVLPEAVEVLMRVLQRAPNPTILARPLLQLESAVAWLPLSAAEEHGLGRNATSRRDFGNDHGGGDDDDGEGGSRSHVGKGSGGGGGSSGTSGVGVGRDRGKDGSDRERNADSLMSRQGWLAWCCRLVDALGARNESGDLVQGRASVGNGADGDIGGSERWGAGGSEASEAGGYLDDSHSETTDTGSAFSYYESSSMGRSLAQDGGAVALEVFTGPVYGLVAALLEQDMARAPRDKRGHRFLDLFSLAAADVFQAAVIEDVLDGIQDSPMLSSDTGNNAQQQQHELSLGKSGAGAAGGGLSGDGGSDGNVRRLESLRELLSAALDRKPDLPLALCVKSVHTINLLGYHNSHQARNWMKTVGLLGVRDDLIRRCLFHPTASPTEQVSAISQVEDALETLVSQPGKSAGEVESSLAGEVAVQLMHLFTQATINAANPLPQPPAATTTTGPPSPLVRSNTATNAARAVQIAAARALGRTAAASSACRSTVIRLARDPQLLARLLSALRCPLTAEEMEAIELGNIPDAAPTLTSGSRWSIGSLNLLPSATASTSCMSDDAEDDDPEIGPRSAVTTNQQPSPTNTITNGSTNIPARAFFPTTPTPSANTAGPRPPSLHHKGSSSLGTSGGNLSGFPEIADGLSGSGPAGGSAGVNGGPSSQFRLDEVLEDVEEEDGARNGEEQTEIDEGVALGTESGGVVEGEHGGVWGKSPVRRRGRRRSSSDLSAGSLGSFNAVFGNGGGGAAAGVPRARAGQSVGGSSWHGPNNCSRSAGVGGGWGVPENDLHAFVRWYNGEDRRGMREGVRRRVSTALAPLDKARAKAAAKHAAKREKAVRQTQKREAEAAAVKEKAAKDAVERCRAHAERAADRTSTVVISWLAERRRRWEAGRTRCEELAPPAGGTRGGMREGGAPGSAVRGPKHTVGDVAVTDGQDGSDGPGGGRGQSGVASALGWDWAKGGGEGLSFEEFFETFAGGDVHRGEEEQEEGIVDDDMENGVLDHRTRNNDISLAACDP